MGRKEVVVGLLLCHSMSAASLPTLHARYILLCCFTKSSNASELVILTLLCISVSLIPFFLPCVTLEVCHLKIFGQMYNKLDNSLPAEPTGILLPLPPLGCWLHSCCCNVFNRGVHNPSRSCNALPTSKIYNRVGISKVWWVRFLPPECINHTVNFVMCFDFSNNYFSQRLIRKGQINNLFNLLMIYLLTTNGSFFFHSLFLSM